VTYSLTVTQKPEYLHFVVTGRNSSETVSRYMEEVIRECTARSCFRVLIEERLEGPRLGTLEVFSLATKGSARHQGVFRALAYVDVHAEGERMRFAEDVAVNRGVPIRVFATVEEAERWLRHEGGDRPTRSPP